MATPLSDISQNDFLMKSPVMDPDADHSTSCEFSDKVPPRFDGHSAYESYRKAVNV